MMVVVLAIAYGVISISVKVFLVYKMIKIGRAIAKPAATGEKAARVTPPVPRKNRVVTLSPKHIEQVLNGIDVEEF